MGKVKRFDVSFASDSAVFYAGQVVSGNVVVRVNETVKLKTVKIRLVGGVSVRFVDNARNKKSHSERIRYFQHDQTLSTTSAESRTGGDVILPVGTHLFPFSYQTAANLPSSYESKLGNVRYLAVATLQFASFLSRDQVARRPFSVVGIVDLNVERSAFTPGLSQTERKFGFADQLFCCASGALGVWFKLNRTAFVPGEQIVLEAEVENNSSRAVRRVEAFIQQNVVYRAKHGRHFERGNSKISLVVKGVVARGQSQCWSNEYVDVPSLPPSKLASCQLIDVAYLFNFVVYVENTAPVLLSVPLVIGTVPLQQPTAQPPTAQQSIPLSPPALEDYIGPPPTYEQCHFMEGGDLDGSLAGGEDAVYQTPSAPPADDADDQGPSVDTFRPLYPTYPTLKRH